MTILAQHGYGKSDYVENGLKNGHITGVILSPKDEEPDSLVAYAKSLRTTFGDKVGILFDPQFYATTIQSASDGNLPDYPYYQPSLSRASFNPTNLQKFATDVVSYQMSIGCLDRIISPSVLFGDFQDPWSQISYSLGQATIDACKKIKKKAPPLLVSIIVDEVALRNKQALDEFLDMITVLDDVHGFYLVVRPEDAGYPAHYEESSIVNLMYLVYALAELNNYEVVCGYADLIGTLLHAVGANATGTGWFTNLKQFSFKRFQKSTISRQGRPRYTSEPLLNSILLNPELKAIADGGFLSQVLSGTAYDGILHPDPFAAMGSWQRKRQCLHHWEILRRLSVASSTGKSIGNRLDSTETLIQKGLQIYKSLGQKNGITFEAPSSRRNLEDWQRAVKSFRKGVGL